MLICSVSLILLLNELTLTLFDLVKDVCALIEFSAVKNIWDALNAVGVFFGGGERS